MGNDDVGIVTLWLLTRLPRPMAILIMAVICVLGVVSALTLVGITLILAHNIASERPYTAASGFFLVAFAVGSILFYIDFNAKIPQREKKK